MIDDQQRRQALADFLKTRRLRLSPSDVGLPPGLRRRIVGLRRQEVAQLAEISTTWYTWLEQGRNINVSKTVLGRIADALQFTPDERLQLFLLAHGQVSTTPLPKTSTEYMMLEEILVFTNEHLDECAHLAVEVFNGEPRNQQWTVKTAKIRFQEILSTPGFVGFVWRKQQILGLVVGNCQQWENAVRFELKTICVRSDAQNRLIGTKLLHQLTHTLLTMNINSVYLLTADDQAEGFYIKNGFQTSSRVRFMSKKFENTCN